MGILSRLLNGQPAVKTVEGLHLQPRRDDAALQIVGEQSYQPALEASARGRTPDGPVARDHVAALLPEPKNRYDPNAIVVQIDARTVGYLSRHDAVAYGPIARWLAERGKILVASAYLTGGWDRGRGDRGSIGVVLHLGTPAECAAELISDETPMRTDHPWPNHSIAFTGDSHHSLGGVALDRKALQFLADKAGLTVLPRVTKKVQLLVLCDEGGQTGNAVKAKEYGIPSVSEAAFWQALGLPAADLGRPAGGWRSAS